MARGEMKQATQSDLAREMGISRQAVVKHAKNGLVVQAAGGGVDIAASIRAINAAANPSYAHAAENGRQAAVVARGGDENRGPVSPPHDQSEKAAMSLQAARAIKENYLARMAKLDYEKASGAMVDAHAARMWAADIGATFRAALESLPDRLASELVPLNDADAIRAVLVENFESLLNNIATKIEKGI